MYLSLLSTGYGVKPNFQRAALGTVAGGLWYSKKKSQLYLGPITFLTFLNDGLLSF